MKWELLIAVAGFIAYAAWLGYAFQPGWIAGVGLGVAATTLAFVLREERPE